MVASPEEAACCRRISMSQIAVVEVSISSHPPVRFCSSAEGPTWSQVISRLEKLHGPGALADAEGMQILYDDGTNDIVAPAGSYKWIKAWGECKRQLDLFAVRLRWDRLMP